MVVHRSECYIGLCLEYINGSLLKVFSGFARGLIV